MGKTTILWPAVKFELKIERLSTKHSVKFEVFATWEFRRIHYYVVELYIVEKLEFGRYLKVIRSF